MKEIEELPVDPSFNDLDLITQKHYEKQMAVVKTVINFMNKGMNEEETGRKVQLAASYVAMVFMKGEKEMNNYWRKLYGMKEEK